MKSIRYIMYFVLISMTMSLLAQENAQAVAQGENKIDEKVERNTIRKGNGLFNDKKYTEAEIEYRKALEANPSSEIATYNLGAALYKQQKWNDSRNEYRKIVQASSDSLRAAHAWHNLGNISFQEKNYAPKYDETSYNLSLAQLLLKQPQEKKNKYKNDDKDQQDKNKDQQKDQKQDQQEQNNNQNNQDKNKDQQEQNKPQQQQPQQSQMSKENAQQILDAIQQDERDTQEKVQKALIQQHKGNKTDKDW